MHIAFPPESNRIAAIYDRPEVADCVALTYKTDEVTFDQLHNAVLLCAADLREKGVRKGHHVALWGYGCIEWVVFWLAISRVGARSILVNHSMPLGKVINDLNLGHPDFIVAGKNSETRVDSFAAETLAKEMDIPSHQVIMFNDGRYLQRVQEGERIEASTCPDEALDDYITLLMTSGSVGLPKLVELSQENFLSVARGCYEVVGKNGEFTLALGLPLFHAYGLSVMICYLAAGQHVCLADNLKPDSLIDLVKSSQAGVLSTVGALMSSMAMQPNFGEAAQYIRFVILGGGATPPVVTKTLNEKCPHIALDNGYGLTESCGPISLSFPTDPLEKRAHTIGKPLPCAALKTVREDGSECLVMEHGEILAKGPAIMRGYYNTPAEFQPFTEDGWFRTGDLGYFDSDGYLHFSGRIKEIIIKKGETICPADIEDTIMGLGLAIEAKVGAYLADDGADEEVLAVITPVPSRPIDLAAMRKALAPHLPRTWLPDHLVIIENMPRKATGKIDSATILSIAQKNIAERN